MSKSLTQLLEEEMQSLQKENILLKQTIQAMKAAVVSTIGGTVEGRPTSSINYLQRLRQLVEIEKHVLAAVEAAKPL